MKKVARRAAQFIALGVALLLIVGIAAPYLSGDRFAPRIRSALEADLGRKVDIGQVHFSLFTGPGFSVDNVVIHENPAIGVEPVAYVGSLEAVPRLASLGSGHLEFASIRLDDASINLAKTGEPSEPGHWNFEPLLSASVIRALPELHVRSSRINFKFGDTKSVFYLTDTDLDIAPPSRAAGHWSLEFSGQPARTDKPAHGFGNLVARGRWTPSDGRLDLDARLENSAIEEMAALIHGSDAGVHGTVSAHMHLSGPLDNIKLSGSLRLDDLHRWDLLPPHGQAWPFNLAGRLNLAAQTIELDSSTAGGEGLPLSVKFRCSNYLSQPRWATALNWNRFPVGPLLELARHMGADLPAKLIMTGTLDGVLGYSGQGSAQGELDFHDASMSIPDSPPIRADQARLIFDGGHARLMPALVRTAGDEQANLEGDYDWHAQALDIDISTDAMRVESLRAQSALAQVPWLEQVPSGAWRGQLHYRICGGDAGCAQGPSGWSGKIELTDARFALSGIADQVQLQSATATIEGPAVRVDNIHAEVGKIAVAGDYHYVPGAVRPHRLHIAIADADASELERLLMPCLHHSRGLLARALSLGRNTLPEWLTDRHLDVTVRIASLRLEDIDVGGIQAHLLWDAAKAEFADVRATVDGGQVTGALSVNLRGSRPVYQLTAKAKGIEWKSGLVDTDSVLEASGVGAELLARLHSAGTFTARGVEMDALPDLESASGVYDLSWTDTAPRLRFSELQVVSGADTYSGQGSTQPDGKLLIQLSGGGKEMHMSGTLAELKVEQPETR